MKTQTAFVENECTVKFGDKEYTSGGAYILPCTDGKMRGLVYVNHEKRTVTDWHSKHIANLDTVSDYRGNFCAMRRITFTLDGRKFVGEYCPNCVDACKVRSTK